MRDRAVVAHHPHKVKVGCSIHPPATILFTFKEIMNEQIRILSNDENYLCQVKIERRFFGKKWYYLRNKYGTLLSHFLTLACRFSTGKEAYCAGVRLIQQRERKRKIKRTPYQEVKPEELALM